MAITAQEQATPGAPRPSARAPRTTSVWTRPAQLRQAAPIIRLIAALAAIPEVSHIGMLVDGDGIQVRILMPKDSRPATGRIFAAEADYLNATSPHNFELHVTPISRLPLHLRSGDLLAGYETVLTR